MRWLPLLAVLLGCGPERPHEVWPGRPCYWAGLRVYLPAASAQGETFECRCGGGLPAVCVWSWAGSGNRVHAP